MIIQKTMTQDEANRLFNYRDGKLYWKIKTARRIKIGDEAGSKNNCGYKMVGFGGKLWCVHRIIFCMHHGYFPNVIDHINGNPLDNRIENLRSVTFSQNVCNAKIKSDNTSGVKGIFWRKRDKKWEARIQMDGKRKHLGTFECLEKAKEFLMLAREMVHGEYARHA